MSATIHVSSPTSLLVRLEVQLLVIYSITNWVFSLSKVSKTRTTYNCDFSYGFKLLLDKMYISVILVLSIKTLDFIYNRYSKLTQINKRILSRTVYRLRVIYKQLITRTVERVNPRWIVLCLLRPLFPSSFVRIY